MSMSVHIIGMKDPTKDYIRKRTAYVACLDAGVEPPKELTDYFGGVREPSASGIEIHISAYVDGNVMSSDGAIVCLPELVAAGITRLRVFCS